MFNCEHSLIQGYMCQVYKQPNWSNKPIAFDACLGSELIHLWNNGIKTIGCCCGNHLDCYQNDMSYIQVSEEYIDKMLDMGYNLRYNHLLEVQNCFIPKTELR